MKQPLLQFHRSLVIALVVIATTLVAPQARADSSWVTAGDLVDAILQARTFTAQQLTDLDLNAGGVIDVLDLVCFVSSS